MADTVTQPEGPVVAQKGQHVFEMEKLDPFKLGPTYTDARGTAAKGDRMTVGLVRLPAGAVTELHHHPNEQWMYIIQGTWHAEIEGKMYLAKAGSAVYIPSNLPHGGYAGPDSDLVFFTCKDNSWGIQGIKGA